MEWDSLISEEIEEAWEGGSHLIFEQTTCDIAVSIEPFFLEDQSEPEAHYYVWAYHVRIKNTGRETVRLITWRWTLTDRAGMVREVRGDHVDGEQPILTPGDIFEYTNGVPLATPSGIMVGVYGMALPNGKILNVGIPAFSLDSPHDTARFH